MVALLTASIAQAAPPTITPAPGTNFVDTTTCRFPVAVTYVVNGQAAKAFTDGRTIVSGPLAAQFAANGKSVTLNISGPATITATGSSVTIVGHGLGAGPASTANRVTIAYMTGQVSVDPDTGVATLEHGHFLLDIWAALAS